VVRKWADMCKERTLLKTFWACGDCETIEQAIARARLNRHEKEVITLILDECFTQEAAAEELNISVRELQNRWYSAAEKLLAIPWVLAYAEKLTK